VTVRQDVVLLAIEAVAQRTPCLDGRAAVVDLALERDLRLHR
jgi:hypothetical protein